MLLLESEALFPGNQAHLPAYEHLYLEEEVLLRAYEVLFPRSQDLRRAVEALRRAESRPGGRPLRLT